MPTNADLGRAVRRLRQARRLSIEALASKAEMHPTYLSGIERGVRNPTWAIVCGLASALDVSVSSVTQDAEDEATVAQAVKDTRARIEAERGLSAG
jgi:transcriptional regulator with XRE-family HTH domain